MQHTPPDQGAPGGVHATSPGARRFAFRILFFSLIWIGIGNSILFVVLPPAALEMGLSKTSVGWIYSISALLWSLTSPFWGRVSNDWGRKPTIVTGLTGYAVSMGLFTLVATLGLGGWGGPLILFWGLALSRALFGAVGSACWPAAMAYVADRTSARERTGQLAGLSAAFAVGTAIGPGVGPLLEGVLGFAGPLLIVTAAASIGVAAIVLYLPERSRPVRNVGAGAPISDLIRIAKDRRMTSYWVIAFLISVSVGVRMQTATFHVTDQLGLEADAGMAEAGQVLMLGAFALLFAQLALVPRMNASPRVLIVSGLGLIALSFALLAASWSALAFSFAHIVAGIGQGLATAGYTGGASLAVDQDEQGQTAGMITATAGGGFILAPIFGLYLYETVGMSAPFQLQALVLGALAAYAVFSPTLRRAAESHRADRRAAAEPDDLSQGPHV